jgi:signal transduction histidine kinase
MQRVERILARVTELPFSPVAGKILHLARQIGHRGAEETFIAGLLRVLGNAAKFTDRGKIVLSASVKHKLLQITAADTGIGIDPEQQKIIFDGFRQADENDTRR